MRRLEKIILGLVVLVSIIFQIHNISLFNPNFGFDGIDHQNYINWIIANQQLPLPGLGWEYTQNPLYYVFGALFKSISLNPQYLNLIAFIAIGYAIYKYSKSPIALLAFVALPVANYLVPQISNEYMSGMWIIISLLLILKIPKQKDSKSLQKQTLLSSFLIVIGFYTKYTALSLLPILALAIFLNPRFSPGSKIKSVFLAGLFALILISPILIRNFTLYGKPFIVAQSFTTMAEGAAKRNLTFFTRLDWIFKTDIYKAHDYSFSGGLWNTFWHDGENSITPVVTLHKKALGLWLLGFPLLIMSVIGLVQIYKKERAQGIILFSYVLVAILSLVMYNISVPCGCSVKAFYALGLIVPYVLGLSEFSKMGKWPYWLIIFLLSIQYLIMVSYFWIQPWWHVAKTYK